MVRKKHIKVGNKQMFLERYYTLINTFFPDAHQMTATEAKVLACFMSLEGEVAVSDRFGPSCRKMVKTRLGLSNSGISNYLKALKGKGIIIDDAISLHTLNIFETPYEKTEINITLEPETS